MRDGMAVRSGRNMRNMGRRRTNNASRWAGWLAAVALRHPGAMLGGLIFMAALTAVSVNALTLQSARTPLPLLQWRRRARSTRTAQATPPAVPHPPAGTPADGSAARPPPPRNPRPTRAITRPCRPPGPTGERAAFHRRNCSPHPFPRHGVTRPLRMIRAADGRHDRESSGDGDGPTRTGSTGPTDPRTPASRAPSAALDALGYGPLDGGRALTAPMTRDAIERFEQRSRPHP